MNPPETRRSIQNKIAGIILAAGESSRMGCDKALLRLGPRTFVEHLALALRPETEPLVIVLGHHAAEIEAQLPPELRAAVLRNQHYRLGQLSSLKIAIARLSEGDQSKPVSGALVCLVDTPAISKQVVRAVLAEFRRSGAAVVIPTCRGRRGHPVLFARSLFPELLEAPLEQGARVVVQRYAEQVQLVETEDEGILLDIDRPEDYRALLARWPTLNASAGGPGEPAESPGP